MRDHFINAMLDRSRRVVFCWHDLELCPCKPQESALTSHHLENRLASEGPLVLIDFVDMPMPLVVPTARPYRPQLAPAVGR